ncbi:hypothetical protein C8J57DRAFT_1234170 [Mycena rebaudengoi]|nr:hypothetical protein C8J57DRAFT_1234170 [Mycena rebaudengoi]
MTAGTNIETNNVYFPLDPARSFVNMVSLFILGWANWWLYTLDSKVYSHPAFSRVYSRQFAHRTEPKINSLNPFKFNALGNPDFVTGDMPHIRRRRPNSPTISSSMSNGMRILLMLAFVQIASRTMWYHLAVFVANTPPALRSRRSQSLFTPTPLAPTPSLVPAGAPKLRAAIQAAITALMCAFCWSLYDTVGFGGSSVWIAGLQTLFLLTYVFEGVYASTLQVLNAEPMTLRTQVSLTASSAMKRYLHGDYKFTSDTIRKFRGHVSPLTDSHRLYLWLLHVDLGKEPVDIAQSAHSDHQEYTNHTIRTSRFERVGAEQDTEALAVIEAYIAEQLMTSSLCRTTRRKELQWIWLNLLFSEPHVHPLRVVHSLVQIRNPGYSDPYVFYSSDEGGHPFIFGAIGISTISIGTIWNHSSTFSSSSPAKPKVLRSPTGKTLRWRTRATEEDSASDF